MVITKAKEKTMAKCSFCNKEIAEWDRKTMSHLIITKDEEDGSFHTHGPIENPGAIKELINSAREVVSLPQDEKKLSFTEVIFHNRQRIGDIFMFTCAVRDFKKAFPDVKVNVMSTAMHIWDNNPYIDKTIKQRYAEGKTLENVTAADFLAGHTNVLKIGPGYLTNASNRIDWHFSNAYRCSIEQALNIHIPQGESRGDIWMTEEEANAPRLFKDPYWLIVVSGEKGWGCKMYPFERWQEFINQNKDTLFVQLGTNGDNPPRLQGSNVIDYVGKTEDKNTGIRDLYKLSYNAEGSISLVSFAMHLSGALHKPALVVAGAREPVSFTQYHGHRYLATDGCLPCSINACWHCDINTCTALNEQKVPKCVEMISPEDLTRALNSYYIGGRLKKSSISDKPKNFKNIVKAPKKVEDPKPTVVEEKSDVVINEPKKECKLEQPKSLIPNCSPGYVAMKEEKRKLRPNDPERIMSWGDSSIFEEDWTLLKKVIDEYGVKSVIEFGAGLSTVLFNDLGLKVVTFENDERWIDSVKKLNPNVDIRIWDRQDYDIKEHFDMAFVDGPAAWGPMLFGRRNSIKAASEVADIVLVHDATRPGELLWQDTYLKEHFDLLYKGGKFEYCHVWVRKTLAKKELKDVKPISLTQAQRIPVKCPESKQIKIITTARGGGGQAKSVMTIMKYLLKAGQTIEFLPFRDKVTSREFLDFFKEYPEIRVTDKLHSIREACDVMLVYGDDYIWEFGQPEIVSAFSNLDNAKKKIMMLNYRRGKVGEIEWTKGWDLYMFLNSIQEKELLKVLPDVKTKVLPPCVELEDFFAVSQSKCSELRIVRHSSQGDTKFDKNTTEKEINDILEARPDATIQMMPGPGFVNSSSRFIKQPRGVGLEVPQFLALGNLFWYSLPKGYPDMGPRVILEAMAVGLPIIADNWGGAVDRVTPECGWLCDTKEQMLEIIKNVTPEELAQKGKAAKARAMSEFIPQRWVAEILR